MGLLECIKELLRPELQIDPEIVERERKADELSSHRKDWRLNHVYLCEGDLKELEKHPDYHPFEAHHIFAHFAGFKRHKRIIVVGIDAKKLEEELKSELYKRGCNAGIFYRTYSEGGSLVGETVPARLDCE